MNKSAPPVLHDLIDVEEKLLTNMLRPRNEPPTFITWNLSSIIQYAFIFALGFIVSKLFFN